MTHEKMIEKANMFANGKPGATLLNNGPETGFEPGWWPTVAGKYVNCGERHPTPKEGFPTKATAIACAKEYKAMSREWLEANDPPHT